MANETMLTIVGNLTADPELRYTPNGVAVVNFTVASTPRVWSKQSNQWEDGEPLFMRCSAWRDLAENIAASVHKGQRVIVQGSLKQRSWEKDGQKHTVIELDVQEVGPSLRYATAQVTRQNRAGGAGNPAAGGNAWQGQNQPQAASSQAWGGDHVDYDSAPF
ncbi:single-stranded DNA-binding protein [Pseudoclavibacter alba]|uniref:Single-stranded DNA-binding protein n=1 Tax=Pseudoclavibacter albus TaxID=272241 RepID=A0ABT2HWX3_9MICO|nr:single-stranded DNA-binding protein [Pseudoclavibacter alba]MCT2042631.1 single-stranded DNA-binding protein [Pseudoclavibacter alba]